MMAHADETDDSHPASRCHPGCATTAAALAVGEELGASGELLLRAVVLGYDVGTRVVLARGVPHSATPAASPPTASPATFVPRQPPPASPALTSGRVMLVADEQLSEFLPARISIVEIAFDDGTHLAERVEAVRGTVRNPMSRAEVSDKARDLMVPILGRSTCERLITCVYAIEDIADVRQLAALLRRP
jgi:2-methylcitrate dehydratase PrpD